MVRDAVSPPKLPSPRLVMKVTARNPERLIRASSVVVLPLIWVMPVTAMWRSGMRTARPVASS